MKKIQTYAIIVAAVFTAATTHAKTFYGMVSTSMEEGNGRLVCADTDALSKNPAAPTPLTELATVEHANDFMAGTSTTDGTYYCYYNTYDPESGVSMQYFGTLDFETGAFSLIAEDNHAVSDNVTDMLDMVYDPVGRGLLGLDRQYVPADNKFVSTIQNISMQRGSLTEIMAFDRKYTAICSDGAGGYWLATLDRDAYGEYLPTFWHADNRFNCTQMTQPDAGHKGESSFAHSMAMADDTVWLVTGSIVTSMNIETHELTTYYLEKQLGGLTFIPTPSAVEEVAASIEGTTEYYDLQGRRLTAPAKGSLCIERSSQGVRKLIVH